MACHTVFISEKPSVAQEFAAALGENFKKRDGYLESENTIVTWCVGHLVSMSYPEAYDARYKKWALSTIPFIPDKFRYEVIGSVKKQFSIVSKILTSPDVKTIYICTDSGREGEYIYRLVAQQAGVKDKRQLRVWIDSQTREEILRGIREAKDDSAYDPLGAAAYLRAKEDYLMGINFSRVLTLRYSRGIRDFLGQDKCVIAVGRVMTCVLGMVVKREREIRSFVKTPFYRVFGHFGDPSFEAEWKLSEKSMFAGTPALYEDKGLRSEEDAKRLIASLDGIREAKVTSSAKKKETKNPPLLYNLAELQNDCSRMFRISPDETLQAAQTLYERKLTTYPRTDARVLLSAVAKEISKNLAGLRALPEYRPFAEEIRISESWKKIGKTRYCDDKAITDHYAIIPTGQGFQALDSLPPTVRNVYELIVRRFLAIFYPPSVSDKITLTIEVGNETFQAAAKALRDPGYLRVMEYSFSKKKSAQGDGEGDSVQDSEKLSAYLSTIKKGSVLPVGEYEIRQGETSPPRRYSSGSMILAMENAGQLIEEEELREQIKGSGIGTSATRAGILEKLFRNRYLSLNKKTQIITPTQMGEMIYDTVSAGIRPLLDPKLTASWEMGLTRVAEGSVTEAEYMKKLEDFIVRRTNYVKETDFSGPLQQMYRQTAAFYQKGSGTASSGRSRRGSGKSGSRNKTEDNTQQEDVNA